MSLNEGEDLWTANDKIYHVIFCFSLTLIFSLLASKSPFLFFRRRHIAVGSLLSLSAGAVKEFADHLGFFRSSGASFRDAVADLAGVLLAAAFLSFPKFVFTRRKLEPDRPIRCVEIV